MKNNVRAKDPKFPAFDFIEKMPLDSRLIIAGASKLNPQSRQVTLVFMVRDEENPQIPGYPAWCVGGNGDLENSKKFIKATYKRLNFKPKHGDF